MRELLFERMYLEGRMYCMRGCIVCKDVLYVRIYCKAGCIVWNDVLFCIV